MYLGDVIIFLQSVDHHTNQVRKLESVPITVSSFLMFLKYKLVSKNHGYLGHIFRPGKMMTAEKTSRLCAEACSFVACPLYARFFRARSVIVLFIPTSHVW